MSDPPPTPEEFTHFRISGSGDSAMAALSVLQFRYDYYRRLNFDFWLRRIQRLRGRRDLKTRALRFDAIIELYTSFLQLLEILFINTLIAWNEPSDFPALLTITNKQLQKAIEQHLLSDRTQQWLLDVFMFGRTPDAQPPDYQQRVVENKHLLKQLVELYLRDYELLNSYKHGFRLSAFDGSRVKAGGETLFSFDSGVTYFTRARKLDTIVQTTISFNYDHIRHLCIYAYVLLRNIRNGLLLSSRPVHNGAFNVHQFRITDFAAFANSAITSRHNRIAYQNPVPTPTPQRK